MKQQLPLSLALALLFPAALNAQDIPNAGFEDWYTQGGFEEPIGWRTSNWVSYSVDGSLTCEPGSPGVAGAHFVKVTDRFLDGMGMQQASIDIGTQGLLFPGFPFSGRPDAFNGFRQYHPVGIGNDGVVGAVLSRWNADEGHREVIANAPIHALGPITSWEAFSVPFLYYSELDPDTANVLISASQNTSEEGTSIWVDELSFGEFQSVQEEMAVAVQLWPSPARDQLRISADALLSEVIVKDMSGRVMSRNNVKQTVFTLPVTALPSGLYLADLRLSDGRRVVRSFVKE